jgi:hypothetical protein
VGSIGWKSKMKLIDKLNTELKNGDYIAHTSLSGITVYRLEDVSANPPKARKMRTGPLNTPAKSLTRLLDIPAAAILLKDYT